MLVLGGVLILAPSTLMWLDQETHAMLLEKFYFLFNMAGILAIKPN